MIIKKAKISVKLTILSLQCYKLLIISKKVSVGINKYSKPIPNS